MPKVRFCAFLCHFCAIYAFLWDFKPPEGRRKSGENPFLGHKSAKLGIFRQNLASKKRLQIKKSRFTLVFGPKLYKKSRKISRFFYISVCFDFTVLTYGEYCSISLFFKKQGKIARKNRLRVGG